MRRTILLLFWNLLIVSTMPLYSQVESWKFIIYGDTRSLDNNHRAVLQAIVNNTPDYKFMINVGDVVHNGELLSDWQIWQKACDDILGGIGQNSYPPKYMACPGNHDEVKTLYGLANWTTFLYGQAQQFGNNGTHFYFDYENARFIILNSDYNPIVKAGPQYDMLMEAIQNNPKQWLFAIWHNPIFDFGPKDYRDDIHESWGIPLYENKCDIMFMGHAHYYIRSKKLELNGEMNPPLDSFSGTVHIVTGNGGASLYNLDPNHDGNGYMVEAYTDTYYGYCELTVDGNTLLFRHILSDGSIIDEELHLKPDNPPSVSILNPSNNSTVYGDTIIQVSAYDDNRITRVKFYIDGVEVENDVIVPYQYSWDTTLYSNGNHTIKAVAYDTLNQTAEDEKTVTVNNVTQYILTIASGFGGTTEPPPGSHTFYLGKKVSVRAIPKDGYQFIRWSGNASGTINPITITIDSDTSITAHFLSVDHEGNNNGKDFLGIDLRCFIATAAFNSPLHPYVNTLRDFRDKYLMPSMFGHLLVGIYYKYSPFVANLIAKHKALKFAAKINLLPLVAFSYSMVHFGPLITAVMLFFIFLLPIFLILFHQRKLKLHYGL